MLYKAVILIAGPKKGTRFRPLSLDVPKPLFPVAGVPVIQHLIEAISRVRDRGVREILLLGCYSNEEMTDFVQEMNRTYGGSAGGEGGGVSIRYLQEYTPLGTAGGIFHFRDRILSGNPDAFFVFNGDVCADFPLASMLEFHERGGGGGKRSDEEGGATSSSSSSPVVTLMATEATKQQSLNYGCIVEDKDDHTLLHYVEKPSSYVSPLINCGVYLFSKELFPMLQAVYQEKQDASYGDSNLKDESICIERDILPAIANTGRGRVYQTTNWWSQVKTAGSAIYANRHYLALYQTSCPQRLSKTEAPQIIGNVFVHPSAIVHPTAVLGPNVSLGENVNIRAGARIKESIILANSTVGEHSLILYTVIGMNTNVGNWTRVEGTPNDPNPNKPFTKMENLPLFNAEGKLNPSITILGCNVEVTAEIMILNAIVLPHKQIDLSFKNEIVL